MAFKLKSRRTSLPKLVSTGRTFEQARQSWPSWAPRAWSSGAYRPRRRANDSNAHPLPRCRSAARSARQIIRPVIGRRACSSVFTFIVRYTVCRSAAVNRMRAADSTRHSDTEATGRDDQPAGAPAQEQVPNLRWRPGVEVPLFISSNSIAARRNRLALLPPRVATASRRHRLATPPPRVAIAARHSRLASPPPCVATA